MEVAAVKIATLMEAAELRDDRSIDCVLGDLQVDADCSSLRVRTTNLAFPWDEQAERAVAGYLNIPKTYLHRCEPAFRASTVNHWLTQHDTADTTVQYARGGDHSYLIALQSPDRPVLPLTAVGKVITDVFDPNDDVINIARDEKTFHIDICTSHSVEVPPLRSMPDRAVGDITRGGVRITAAPHDSTAPTCQAYFHRLACTNGMTSLRSAGTIKLKGRTVLELIDELEIAAQRTLGGMNEYLADYAKLASTPVPGNPAAFTYRVAEENKLGPRLTEQLMGRVGGLPVEDVSLYDIANVFTETAQSGGLTYKNTVKLQEIAGVMAFATDEMLNRCKSCEQQL